MQFPSQPFQMGQYNMMPVMQAAGGFGQIVGGPRQTARTGPMCATMSQDFPIQVMGQQQGNMGMMATMGAMGMFQGSLYPQAQQPPP